MMNHQELLITNEGRKKRNLKSQIVTLKRGKNPMKKHETKLSIIPNERIIKRIFWLRGKKVMFDTDLAELYDVPTMRLNEQVRRNKERFPGDFMFQLTSREMEILRSQFATSSL